MNNNAYLILLDTEEEDDRLEFQYLPKEISVNRQVQLASVQIVGRSNSISHYIGGDDTLPLKLEFYAEDEAKQDVRDKCAWLQSLAYGLNVKLVFGKLFRNEVWILESVKVNFGNFSGDNDLLPLTATVDLSLKLNPNKSISYKNVRFQDRFTNNSLAGGDETTGDYGGYA
jgi:hypothetical protein